MIEVTKQDLTNSNIFKNSSNDLNMSTFLRQSNSLPKLQKELDVNKSNKKINDTLKSKLQNLNEVTGSSNNNPRNAYFLIAHNKKKGLDKLSTSFKHPSTKALFRSTIIPKGQLDEVKEMSDESIIKNNQNKKDNSYGQKVTGISSNNSSFSGQRQYNMNDNIIETPNNQLIE